MIKILFILLLTCIAATAQFFNPPMFYPSGGAGPSCVNAIISESSDCIISEASDFIIPE